VALIAAHFGGLRTNGKISESLSLTRKAGLVLAPKTSVRGCATDGGRKTKPNQIECANAILTSEQ
jgi:hypothetical protein